MNIATTFARPGLLPYFSPQRSSTRGLGHIAKKRFDAGHLQLGENSRNTRTSSTGFEPDARIEIHRHYREQPKRTRPTCRRMPFTGALGEVCPLGLTPTTSTTLMTVIGDILVVGAMETTHFDAHQYALRHHGGYLGTRSREQSQNK